MVVYELTYVSIFYRGFTDVLTSKQVSITLGADDDTDAIKKAKNNLKLLQATKREEVENQIFLEIPLKLVRIIPVSWEI